MSRGRIETTLIRTLTRTSGHVAAASGLVVAGKYAHVVADDENLLFSFPLEGGDALEHALIVEDLPEEHFARKRKKPDFEALTLAAPDTLLAFGSGSTPTGRDRAAMIRLDEDGRPAMSFTGDCHKLYDTLRKRLPALNIEGAAVLGDTLVLGHRANGRRGTNALIRLGLEWALKNEAATRYTVAPVDLGNVAESPIAFTDLAPLPDGRLVFVAAAEASPDTFLDGEYLGSFVGVVRIDGRIESLIELGVSAKVEGVWVERIEDEVAHLLLVTDADKRSEPAQMLRVALPLPPQ